MKKLLLPLAIIISISAKAQYDTAMVGEVIGLGNGISSGTSATISGNPYVLVLDTAYYLTAKRHIVRLNEDSAHIYYHQTKNYNSKVSYDFEANRETIKFITPPKYIIVDQIRYKSIYVNNHWYLLMDTNNVY